MLNSFIPAWLEMRKSSECHTLDRDDMHAQKDCGEIANSKWKEVTEQKFKLKYWPFV